MRILFNNIYKDKKVFITGHTGFKGSWLSFWLTKLGAEVTGYSKDKVSEPNHFDLLKLPIKSITGNVLDKEKLYKAIEENKPDIIFHMAAQPLVLTSYKNPSETFETNIMGTVNVLESARLLNIKAIVNITSDKCYKNTEKEDGYQETDPMGGDDPYSSSKGCAELVAHAYRKSFFEIENYKKNHNTLLANVRAGNVIGGGDWALDRLVPDIMKSTQENKKTTIRKPNASRPWQHVLEPLSGYLLIGEKLLSEQKEYSDNWNFGPIDNKGMSVKDVLFLIKENWPSVEYEIQENSENVPETNLLLLNTEKSSNQLNWKSIWNIEKTINKTVSWYKEYYKNNKIQTEKDLEEYITDAENSKASWIKV